MGDSTATDSSAGSSSGSSPGTAAELALLNYLDGLLHDGDDNIAAAPLRETTVESAGESLAPTSGNVRPLADARAARPMRVVEALQTFAEPRPLAEPLPFAEPTRPLRIPLPPIAPSQPVVVPVVIATPIQTPVEIHAKAPVITPTPSESRPAIEPPIAEAPAPAAEIDTPAPPNWAANGRPQWAQQPFECLLFKAGGLTLAVPLVELGSIYPLDESDIAGIFGQIEWFLGLMRTKTGHLRVVDTARVVMPERYRDEMVAGYHFVLSLSNSDWSLGLDAIEGTTLLDPDAVRWRGERSKRPWLAGTVVDKMCALLDVAQLRWMFDQLDRNRQ